MLGVRRKGAFKYHFSVRVHGVKLRDGPAAPAGMHFNVLWKRGDKVASTREKVAGEAGALAFDETISLVCTMYRDPTRGGQFAPKEATFSLLHGRDGKPLSASKQLGRAKVDLSRFASLEATSEELELILLHDGAPIADMALTVSSRWLKNFGRRRAAGDTLVSDSGSECSECSGCSMSSFGSGSSGWPTADDTDAFTDVGSEPGSDAGELAHQQSGLSELADPDTDEEIEAVRAAEAGGEPGARAGARTRAAGTDRHVRAHADRAPTPTPRVVAPPSAAQGPPPRLRRGRRRRG